MLTGYQMEVVGFLTDGGIICRDCGEDGERREMAAICRYSADEGFSPEGVCCDDCGTEIVERDILCADCAGRDYESCVGKAGETCAWCNTEIVVEDDEAEGNAGCDCCGTFDRLPDSQFCEECAKLPKNQE